MEILGEDPLDKTQECPPLSDTLTDIQGHATSVSDTEPVSPDRAEALDPDPQKAQDSCDLRRPSPDRARPASLDQESSPAQETQAPPLAVADVAGGAQSSDSGQNGKRDLAAGGKTAGFRVSAPPSPQPPVEELIADRLRRFEYQRRHEEARGLIPIQMPALEPIGLLVYGDPHTDDDGTDLGLLLAHAELVARTPGLYSASVGDYQNNWVGRLARLYAQQSTTATEAWAITEHWIRLQRAKLLFLCMGNHDLWVGANDPMDWIAARHGIPLKQEWDVRIALRFPGGAEVRVHCAHDFPGSSMWNDAHAPAKALRLGLRDHVAICGHRHHMAYQPVRLPEGGFGHAIRVGSYKRYDQHARQLGHSGQSAPCVLLTIDPRQPETSYDRIKLHWEPQAGAEYLTWLRARI